MEGFRTELHLVVHYCQLNIITIQDRFALLKRKEPIEKLCHAKIFTKLDLRKVYPNNRIKESKERKPALFTVIGHLTSPVMQFVLSNNPAAFVCFMNYISYNLHNISVVVYLDYMLIFLNSRKEYLEHVKALSCL
ncbi:Retrotransposable element Tf2 protein [Rhizoctonia solani]|uniref:Retrotransposable element Tf2 protein n=1 Tax=Rhizoctonia solani TaxID=456999 RepID=A0A8H8T010_9AGAM|nr:Retrotransposable element Tf2 protein [Rhizoctonia solani]QRW22963.1 Retrotransposable element Tf2 protein [Rhizoctonia solani]